MALMLGRQARTFDPRVPHLSSLAMKCGLAPPPAAVDWTINMPQDWGMMLNDRLGCCTCAAAYHAMQLWSKLGRPTELTEPDSKVLQCYEELCGYNPDDPSTDQGAVEQSVLSQWLKRGVPIVEGPNGRSHIKAFIEVDPRHHNDVKRMIADCGLVYVGMNIPQYIADNMSAADWRIIPGGDGTSVGGHAVICPKYDEHTIHFVSWGLVTYNMTWDYWDAYVDECYALAHPWFITATGKTPGGLTYEELDAAMSAIVVP